jgi:branched-chain amino acid transport system substrate-binding protein
MGALYTTAQVPLAHAQGTPVQKGRGSNTLRVAQSAALSGPQAEVGIAFNTGAKAAFAAVNAAGGVHGRLIDFVSLDDGYDPNRAVQNTRQFLSEGEAPVALFGYTGTGSTKAVAPLAKEAGAVLFAPISGSDALQADSQPHVFFVRGTYSDEIGRILQHLTTIGLRSLGVFYQNDGFGQGALALVKDYASRHKLPQPTAVAYDPQSPDIRAAAKALQEGRIQAVLHLSSAQYSARLLKELDLAGVAGNGRLYHYGVSIISARNLVSDAGRSAHGFVIAKRVPDPAGPTPIASDFRRAMQAIGSNGKDDLASAAAMEGYLSARLLVKALQNAGPKIDRSALRNALEGLGRQEIGPFTLTYGPGKHRGSPFVDLVMVRGDLTVAR